MLPRLASLGAGLVLLVLATSGCFTQPSDGVFGPANSLGGVENNSPALSLQASPARGPGPLEVVFSLSALDRDGGSLTWSLDFGDRTAAAAGSDLPASPRHTYKAPGAYLATFKVVPGPGEEAFVSTISIIVLEGVLPGNTTQGPVEAPEYSPPSSGGGGGGGGGGGSTSSTSQTTTSPDTGNATTSGSNTSTSSDPPSNGTSSTSASSTTSSSESTSPSESPSSSDTGTSSSSGTETFSEPTTSTSDTSTTAPPPDPEPTSSESQSSTDPPL